MADEARRQNGSLHSLILSDIEGRIFSGEWPPGHRIPFEHELTEHYRCSRMTVSKALTQLANAGLIERRRKAGSFVARPHSRSAVLEIAEVGAEVAALGVSYAFSLPLKQRRAATAADRARLGVALSEPILALACRHDAAGRPFCFEDRLISLTAVPEAARESFGELSPGSWLLARAPWTSAEHRIAAAGADSNVAAALDLAPGAPVLVIRRRTFVGEQPVTQVKLTYPAHAHELVARFTPVHS